MILELKDIRMQYFCSPRCPANEQASEEQNPEEDMAVSAETQPLPAGVTFSVEEGTVAAIIGANGAGKTTLFNIISGYEKAFQGKILFNGREISGLSAPRIARLGIGRLFQGRQLMGGLTLMENLVIASEDVVAGGSVSSALSEERGLRNEVDKRQGRGCRLDKMFAARYSETPFASVFSRKLIKRNEEAKRQKAIVLLSKLFGPGNKYLGMLETKASELSYGEQRLMAIVRLLMQDNELLLLDEPTSGINPKYIEVFRNLIRNMVAEEKKTVLMIEHNMSFVRSVADRCHYLSEGKLVYSGNVAEVLDNTDIRKDYMGL